MQCTLTDDFCFRRNDQELCSCPGQCSVFGATCFSDCGTTFHQPHHFGAIIALSALCSATLALLSNAENVEIIAATVVYVALQVLLSAAMRPLPNALAILFTESGGALFSGEALMIVLIPSLTPKP